MKWIVFLKDGAGFSSEDKDAVAAVFFPDHGEPVVEMKPSASSEIQERIAGILEGKDITRKLGCCG